MKNLTLENITKVCNGIYHGPQEKLQEEVTAITTDSRKVEKGGLFVLTRKRIFVRIKTVIAMRKLIYFPIVSLMAVTGKSRPQGKQAG